MTVAAFTGRQHKGARKVRQALKREQAEERNARTPVQRTKRHRRLLLGKA